MSAQIWRMFVETGQMCSSCYQTRKTLRPNTAYDNVATVRMYRTVSLTAATNKDLVW